MADFYGGFYDSLYGGGSSSGLNVYTTAYTAVYGGAGAPSVQITGTPAQAGTYTFTATATDASGNTASATYTITIGAVPLPPGPSPGKSWHWLIAMPQPDGTYLAEITQAQSRTFTVRAGPGTFSEASADVNGADPAIPADGLTADMHVLLGGTVLFCGRIGAVADTLDASRHRLAPVALDYREVLRRRSLAYGGGPPFTSGSDDVADIAWGLVRKSSYAQGGQTWTGVQGYPGGDLGIARGAGSGGLGVTQVINYIRQQFAGIEIDNLAQLSPGFTDWDITPYGPADLRLDLWAGNRGTDRGVILEWGGDLVSAISRSTDPSQFANSVLVTGNSLTASTTVESNSSGGTISNIATWSSPSPGVLDVASVSGFGPLGGLGSDPGGGLTVHASGHTNALLAYTGTSGSTFTGCRYISGSASGTVSTGNSVSQTPLSNVQRDASDIAVRPEGRWDQVISTQHTNQGVLNSAATWYLQDSEVVLPSYQITLYPGAWQGPGHIWVGDTVTVRIKSGRLAVNDPLPVTEMAFTVGADNVETAVLTVGRIPFREHMAIPRMLRRLRALESL